MVSSTAVSSAIAGINTNLSAFYQAAAKISKPDSTADASDIVALKQASKGAEVGVAVLKKVLDTTRLIDTIA